MTDRPTGPAGAGPLDRVPSGGLVFGAIASVQFGASLAATLFHTLGAAGTVLLRLASAAIVLVLLWRPSVRGRTRYELALAACFGFVLAAMNLTFYEAIARIPLGIAVAIEFVGPLAVALGGSRRRRDLLWVGLAVVGILALTRPAAHGLDGLGARWRWRRARCGAPTSCSMPASGEPSQAPRGSRWRWSPRRSWRSRSA